MPEPAEKPLQSWKEIAAYLERDERTARRWETEAGLPIRRHTGGRRSSVYAYPSEIEAWRARKPASAPPAPTSRPWAWALATGVVVAGAAALWTLDIDGVEQVGAAGQGVQTIELCKGCDTIGGVSPNGRYLSETDWGSSGDIGIRDFESGEIRRLGSKKSWDDPGGQAEFSIFSPDGSQIAYNFYETPEDSHFFESGDKGGYVIRTIPSDGSSRERTIYGSSELRYILPAGWTKDDRLLVNFQRGDWSNALGLISLETGKLTVLKSIEGQFTKPMLSPDDRWIAYEEAVSLDQPERDIFLLATDGGVERRVTRHPADDFVMGFTPDGRTLLFASNRTGSYGLWALPLSEDAQPGAPTILMRDIGAVHSIGVTADGALVYSRDLGSIDLYRAELDLATGRLLKQPELIPTEVQGSNDGPWLSPDGNRLAYLAAKNPVLGHARRRSIRIYDLRSSEDAEVEVDGADVIGRYGFVWSPDGRSVLSQTRDKRGAWNLAEIDLQTGAATFLVRGVGNQVPPIGWSADGKEALFISNARLDSEPPHPGEGGRTIYSISRGAIRLRLLHIGEVSAFPGGLSPSHDRVAWGWKGWGEGDQTDRIYLMPTTGGEPDLLYSSSPEDPHRTRQVVWAPDGKSLLLLRDPRSEVWILPLDGSPPFETELTASSMRNLTLHPDGKTVFFQAGDRDQRVFKTENYLPRDAASE